MSSPKPATRRPQPRPLILQRRRPPRLTETRITSLSCIVAARWPRMARPKTTNYIPVLKGVGRGNRYLLLLSGLRRAVLTVIHPRSSPEDLAVLEAEYCCNPKPDKSTRMNIVDRVSMGEKEVQVWFF